MINIIKGNSVDLEVLVTLNSVAFDLGGCEIWFTVKDSVSDPDVDAVIQVTEDSGIVITDAAAGQCVISLTPEQTDALPLDTSLVCDVQIRTTEGKVYTVLFDSIQVTPRVTHAFDHA